MNRIAACFIIFVSAVSALAQGNVPTLKQIMDDPSWFARSPEPLGWLADGSGILYDQRRAGVLGRDMKDRLVQLMDGATPDGWPRMLEEMDRRRAIPATGPWSRDGGRLLSDIGGDIFLWETGRGWRQLTRSAERDSSPMFMADPRRIGFRRGGAWFVRDLESGLEAQAAEIRFAENPEEKEEKERSDIEQHQYDLFAFIREADARRRERERVEYFRARLDPTGVPGPFYLDPERRERGQWLSPNGRHLLVAMSPRRSPDDRRDIMPDYVNETGYVRTSRLRPKVGEQAREPTWFALLDLNRLRVHELALDALPGITEDPLAGIRAAAEARRKGADPAAAAADAKGDGKARGVSQLGVRWSDSGRHAAVMLRSNDNKDRWIVALDATRREPSWTVVHHMHDPAWIGWRFNRFGFVPGTETVWFESEDSGWAHLYLCEVGGTARALTEGAWEVRDTTPLRDGGAFLVRTNRGDRGIYEIERVGMDGSITPVTAMGGAVRSFMVSPAEDRLLFEWSSTMRPPELYAVAVGGGGGVGDPVRLTRTDTELFRSFDFTEPELVWIPSTHTEGAIHTRVYLPDPERFPGPRPVVVFAHGAGYLQFAYRGWSQYFREHMFHTLLTERGFIVLGPDFRHSEGYGRDWRTAVYRDMGEPELQDFDDCLAYAAEHWNADLDRVGIYGGSYGGFLTLMGMFLRPDVYKAGAALRSVTDWRQYSHGWTSNPLDTPQVDPEPFDRCSPINHAEGLRGALLMLHGLVDDNVVAQDVIRLSQRLIELEKEHWELALYPVEPHAFREPSGWLDEYRRILRLFELHLLEE
ncbi:MAG: prolyl oligopeptidase family serine peptidase [Phycisphaerales bacterium]|nr:prolyl oligopeptidase family serine peptidase [Planctomycetota bacterium]MCH8508986.1 prolyl oligopeptidase family serine peptidase [Phycisphaerales bacterium]